MNIPGPLVGGPVVLYGTLPEKNQLQCLGCGGAMATRLPHLTIPVGTGTSITTPAVGSLRMNTNINMFEAYDGTNWIPITMPNPDPQTWREWLEKFANDLGEALRNRRDYINANMQERFPGNYEVVQVAGRWDLVFDTPADETWWHLKYD